MFSKAKRCLLQELSAQPPSEVSPPMASASAGALTSGHVLSHTEERAGPSTAGFSLDRVWPLAKL